MKKLLLLVLSLTLSSFVHPPKSVMLQYSFNVGDQVDLTQVTNRKIIQSVMGNDQVIDVTASGVTNLKVVELTATGAKLEVQYSKYAGTMKTPMGELSMDSEAESSSNESKAIKSMMGKKFYVFLTKKGDVEKIENIKNLWSDFSSLGLDQGAMTMATQIMETMFGEQTLRGEFEIAFFHYAETKVKKGDSWKYTSTLPINSPLKVESTSQLTELTSSVASMSTQGAVTTADKEKVADLPNGLKSKFDLSGAQTTTGSADVKTGWPTTLKSTYDVTGKMILLAGGPIPTDMEVPMQIKTESTYTFVRK